MSGGSASAGEPVLGTCLPHPPRWPVGRFRMWFRKGLWQHQGQGSQTPFSREPLLSHEILGEVWALGVTPAGQPLPRPHQEMTLPTLLISQN